MTVATGNVQRQIVDVNREGSTGIQQRFGHSGDVSAGEQQCRGFGERPTDP